ncbi:MAG: sugar ABC transporter permease [Desulfobacterales bacterium]|nr:MAG: sugar ABC transporter permease [Desulfobacterales bacterium]
MKKQLAPFIWVAPVVLVISVFMLFPLFQALWDSVHGGASGGTKSYVGLDNFKELISSGVFLGAVGRTLIFTLTAVALKLLVGGGAALILNRAFWGRNVLRSWLFIPWTIPLFAGGILFLWLLRMNGGLNLMLEKLGVYPVFWLGPKFAMPSIIFLNVWKGFPFFMITILAGLQIIPASLYEAAQIDGASGVQQFRYVTLPGLRNVILIASLLSTVWTFAQFENIYVLTRGGPGKATETLSILIYKLAFGTFNLNMGSAAAVLALPLFLFFIFWLVKLVRKEAE